MQVLKKSQFRLRGFWLVVGALNHLTEAPNRGSMKKVFLFCLTISVAILIGVLTNVAAIKLLQMAVDLSVYGKAFVMLAVSSAYALLGVNLLMKE